MPKYIDLEREIKRLDDELWDSAYISGTALSVVKKTLRKAPAADVKPVVYGEWLRLGFRRQCSKCNHIFDLGTNYCPNCGAYMRGDDE